jgi:hypothetical protein
MLTLKLVDRAIAIVRSRAPRGLQTTSRDSHPESSLTSSSAASLEEVRLGFRPPLKPSKEAS